MTEKLIETLAMFVTGALVALTALLSYALTSYLLSARERNRETARLIKGVMDEKEKEAKITD